MKLSFGNMTVEINIFKVSKQFSEENEVEDVNLIQTLREEHFEKVLCEPFNYEERSEDPDIQLVREITQWTPKPKPLKASRDEIQLVSPVQLKRKLLPKHLKYSFLGE